MAKKIELPPLSPALIEALEELFRDRIPDTVPTPEQVGVLVGQQQVVRFLRREFNRQNSPKDTRK